VSDAIATRPYVESDRPFVFDQWLESFRLSHAAGPFPMRMYRPVYTTAINEILARPKVEVLVACSPDDEDELYGFICHEKRRAPVVHYLYVKHIFRREFRVATTLMGAAGIDPKKTFLYTFKTPMASKIAEHWTGATFDPLIARFPYERKARAAEALDETSEGHLLRTGGSARRRARARDLDAG